MTETPCRYCTDRTLGCHGVCKEYNDWALKHKDEVKQLRSTLGPVLTNSSFTGTSPKPGRHRFERGKARKR